MAIKNIAYFRPDPYRSSRLLIN